MTIAELDVVKLQDGREGTVVHVYPEDKAFEIEFLDPEGYTDSLETVTLSQIEAVIDRPEKQVA